MSKSKWVEMGRAEVETMDPNAKVVWVSDGVAGYARPLNAGETVEQAVANFNEAGEQATEWGVCVDGEWVE